MFSWAEGDSASALPFLLGNELKQDLVSSSRSTMTSGGASIPKRMRPLLADCTTVTRMDSLMRMLSPTFRERTSMIDPSMMSLAATGPSMTLVEYNCRLPVGLFPLSIGYCGRRFGTVGGTATIVVGETPTRGAVPGRPDILRIGAEARRFRWQSGQTVKGSDNGCEEEKSKAFGCFRGDEGGPAT